MQYPIQLNIDRPEKLSRLTTFFRIIMVIPQIVVMYFLAIAACVILFLSWWAILFTGRIPVPFFDYHVVYEVGHKGKRVYVSSYGQISTVQWTAINTNDDAHCNSKIAVFDDTIPLHRAFSS